MICSHGMAMHDSLGATIVLYLCWFDQASFGSVLCNQMVSLPIIVFAICCCCVQEHVQAGMHVCDMRADATRMANECGEFASVL
jgi:hypothetical protein